VAALFKISLDAQSRRHHPQPIKRCAKGVEVVSAELNDIDFLIPTFKGINLNYGVTNFFESFFTESAEKSMEVEYLQGTNIAKAAAGTTSLEHFFRSTLRDTARS
jgi:hypothetical protein